MIPVAFRVASETLDRRLDRGSAAPLAVALSGGSDSVALLHISHAWADAVQRPLVAMTVDHGLHADSGTWTLAAAAVAGRLGVPWRRLMWVGAKPATGLPAAARRARHALLAEAARSLGVRVLLLGHTADDVAESELIRTETATHGRLAEWSPSPVWPEGRGMFVLRPMLGLRRADLRAWLAALDVPWLEDPANADPRFARSRARLRLAQPTPDPALQFAGRIRAAGAAVPDLNEERAGSIAREHPTSTNRLDRFGALDLDLNRLTAAGSPERLLAKALLCVAGRSRPPRGPALKRLVARLGMSEPFTATLSGVRVRAEGGRARLTRELGRWPPSSCSLSPNAAQVFDGRFEMTAQAAPWRVAPLAGHAAALPSNEREALRAAPKEARPSLPVLLGPGGEVRLPQPFGSGPALARSLVGGRLASVWGLFTCESTLEQAPQSHQARGATHALILS